MDSQDELNEAHALTCDVDVLNLNRSNISISRANKLLRNCLHWNISGSLNDTYLQNYVLIKSHIIFLCNFFDLEIQNKKPFDQFLKNCKKPFEQFIVQTNSIHRCTFSLYASTQTITHLPSLCT